MLGVLIVPAAEFLLGDLVRRLPLIAKGGVIDALAFGALQLNGVRHGSNPPLAVDEMEPGSRIELPTSSLPRKRSTTELPGPPNRLEPTIGTGFQRHRFSRHRL